MLSHPEKSLMIAVWVVSLLYIDIYGLKVLNSLKDASV